MLHSELLGSSSDAIIGTPTVVPAILKSWLSLARTQSLVSRAIEETVFLLLVTDDSQKDDDVLIRAVFINI
jgi:hypothetical protein